MNMQEQSFIYIHFSKNKHADNVWSIVDFKGTVVNLALLSLRKVTLEITLTVHLSARLGVKT